MYQDYAQHELTVAGRKGWVICPAKEKEGRPYIWRTEFLGAFDYADREMLRRGWHLAYYQVSDMYGAPEAVGLMRGFQERIEQAFGLGKRPILFGFSRGGLYAVNYAAAYPDSVGGLYLDAPVLDIFSWPGGFGTGSGAEKEWEKCKGYYHITDKDRGFFHQNPLDKAGVLREHQLPILVVAGDSDEIVPFEENGKKLAEAYTRLGGEIKLIVKKGIGHHPHSLEDPAPIVEYLEKTALK